MNIISEPTVAVRFDKHRIDKLYVLGPSDRLAHPTQPGKFYVGPLFVVVTIDGNSRRAKKYEVTDKALWKWAGPLMRVGVWALTNKRASAFLPDEFLSLSPRMRDSTADERLALRKRTKAPKRAQQRTPRGRRRSG